MASLNYVFVSGGGSMVQRQQSLLDVSHVISKEVWEDVKKFLAENKDLGFMDARHFISVACWLRLAQFHRRKEGAAPRL